MTKEQFKKSIAHMAVTMGGEARASEILASCLEAFDPQLAAMVRTVAQTQRAMHRYIKSRVEG